MPKLSTKQEGNLYSAFMSYTIAHTTTLPEERRLHLQMCNIALINAGLPIIKDLLRSFEKGVLAPEPMEREHENGS